MTMISLKMVKINIKIIKILINSEEDEIFNFYLTLVIKCALKFMKIARQKKKSYQKPVPLGLGSQL